MPTLSKIDRTALEQCLQIGERHPDIGRDPESSDADWYERATWACFVLQTQNLRLRPWECPPCLMAADLDDDERHAAARALLRRMLDMGLSRFDPNPAQVLRR